MPRTRTLERFVVGLICITVLALLGGARRRKRNAPVPGSLIKRRHTPLPELKIGINIPGIAATTLAPAPALDASSIFLEGRLFNSGGNGVSNLAVADLNGDGKLDVV